MHDVVGHHNGIVDNQVQRNGNACQRLELHFKPEGDKEDGRYRQVNRKTGNDEEQVTQIPRNKRHKHQQDKHGKTRAKINLIEFLVDIFSGIVPDVYLIPCRHTCLQTIHRLLYLLAQLQLVGCFFGGKVQVNGVQAIDAVIAGWSRFDVPYTYQLIQRNLRTV